MNILETLKTGLSEGRISPQEFEEHQRLAGILAEKVENDAEEAEVAEIHAKMKQILKKASIPSK